MKVASVFLIALSLLNVDTLAKERPKIGLALSGGGARGMAHIGVLKALEELNIPIDYIAGTSIGSLVGALYAAGYSVKEIEDVFSKTDWDDVIFKDRASRSDLPIRRKIDHGRYLFDFEMGYHDGRFVLPSGLVHGQKFSLLLDSLFMRVATIRDFSRLPVPFKGVASDAETGKMVVLDHGNLADAVRASSAYPGLFSPVEIEGKLLLDGGAVNNLPVDVVKKMGADLIIAVDISSPLQSRDDLASFVDYTDQFITILMRKTVQSQRDLADLVIVPKLHDETTFSYKSFEQIVKSGEDETRTHQAKFSRYQLSKEAYASFKNKRRFTTYEPKTIDSIHVEGFQRVDKRTVQSQISLKEASSFNSVELTDELTKIYSLGDFERADFSFREEKKKNILSIRAIEKRWGPNYIHFGVTWDGEIKGKRDGNALVNLQATRLNQLNAEWVTDVQMGTVLKFDSEFYQPLDYSGLFFLAPRISAIRLNQDFYTNQKRVATYEIDSLGGEFDFGLNLKKYGEIRFGIRRGFLNSESELATSALPAFKVQTGAFVTQLKLDRLDSVYFPSNGVYMSADYLSSRSYLGAENIYRKFSAQSHAFYSLGRHTAFVSASGGSSLGSEIPLYDEFLLGGFRSLSGYREEELRGQDFGTGRAGYLYRLPIPSTVFWNKMYLGGWFESGNTWNRKADIDFSNLKYSGTAALGFDSKLGPVFLAYGQSGSDYQQFYISVGRTFGIRSPRVL